jgi:hypothetical protein
LFEDPLFDKLEDGDYVQIMLAGTMQYSVYTHWEGGTECDLNVCPEWTSMRVLDAGERRNCDRMNDIRPDVPLALYTEVDWEHPFVFPNQPIHLFAPLKFT